ncbi:kunitz-type serine protease inhibitor-like [Drosophila serrata]|uniref:kunitz-type serine protease inhibitor-like n=1 Tax=Drosophila serrata TaxID=7274 RepID=UPI000A1D2D67|nr:kunitz-type serine protease inhibitor-like [Drosophila serrata]
MKVLLILSLALALVSAKPYFCSKEPAYGNCTGNYAVWAYSAAENDCTIFVYSGCGGNYNRFHTQERCIDVCINPYYIDYN